MFYRAGDIIKVKENGFIAEILSCVYKQNPGMNNHMDMEYSVRWPHLVGSGHQAHGSYFHNDVVNDWELHQASKTEIGAMQVRPPKGIDFILTDISIERMEMDCQHKNKKVYNSGFSMFEYCDDCGEEFK